jgi:hypothetical protein
LIFIRLKTILHTPMIAWKQSVYHCIKCKPKQGETQVHFQITTYKEHNEGLWMHIFFICTTKISNTKPKSMHDPINKVKLITMYQPHDMQEIKK